MDIFGGLFFALLGAFLIYRGFVGIRTGEITTKKSFMRVKYWYRDYNPFMFKFVVTCYMLGGLFMLVVGVLAHFGIVDMNKEYHFFR